MTNSWHLSNPIMNVISSFSLPAWNCCSTFNRKQDIICLSFHHLYLWYWLRGKYECLGINILIDIFCWSFDNKICSNMDFYFTGTVFNSLLDCSIGYTIWSWRYHIRYEYRSCILSGWFLKLKSTNSYCTKKPLEHPLLFLVILFIVFFLFKKDVHLVNTGL